MHLTAGLLHHENSKQSIHQCLCTCIVGMASLVRGCGVVRPRPDQPDHLLYGLGPGLDMCALGIWE